MTVFKFDQPYQGIVFLRVLKVRVSADGQQHLELRVLGLEAGDGAVVGVRAVDVQVLVGGDHLVGVGLHAGVAVHQVGAVRERGLQVRRQETGIGWREYRIFRLRRCILFLQ